jgi:hypothetical protein
VQDHTVTKRDLPPAGGAAARVPDAVGTLRRAVAAAEADLGRSDPRTADLRARLTRALIEFGRDAEAAGLESGTLRNVADWGDSAR